MEYWWINVIDPSSEEGKQLDALYQKDYLSRGAYLVQAVWVEELIGDIISRSLCADEDSRSLFTSLILNHRAFDFNGKFTIFRRLLEVKYPSILEEYGDVFSEIDKKVIPFRNKLAHCMLYATDEFLKKKYTDRIQLRHYSKGRMHLIEITDTLIRDRLKNCSGIIKKLIDIQSKIDASMVP